MAGLRPQAVPAPASRTGSRGSRPNAVRGTRDRRGDPRLVADQGADVGTTRSQRPSLYMQVTHAGHMGYPAFVKVRTSHDGTIRRQEAAAVRSRGVRRAGGKLHCGSHGPRLLRACLRRRAEHPLDRSSRPHRGRRSSRHGGCSWIVSAPVHEGESRRVQGTRATGAHRRAAWGEERGPICSKRSRRYEHLSEGRCATRDSPQRHKASVAPRLSLKQPPPRRTALRPSERMACHRHRTRKPPSAVHWRLCAAALLNSFSDDKQDPFYEIRLTFNTQAPELWISSALNLR